MRISEIQSRINKYRDKVKALNLAYTKAPVNELAAINQKISWYNGQIKVLKEILEDLSNPKTISVHVQGGSVQYIENIPEGTILQVNNYDVTDVHEGIAVIKGKSCYVTCYTAEEYVDKHPT